jgi:hypothetical protein
VKISKKRGKRIIMRSSVIAIINDKRVRASVQVKVKVKTKVKENSGERKSICS